jgi:hypothetical protein
MRNGPYDDLEDDRLNVLRLLFKAGRRVASLPAIQRTPPAPTI